MSKSNKTAAVESTVAVSKFDQYKSIGMPALLEQHKNLSGVIRFLDAEGLKRGEIAKIVDRKYQHVRNVLITPVGKANTNANTNAPTE